MEMRKIILLCAALLLFQGCVFLPIAGIAVTGGAAYLKYKGHEKEAEALERLKDDIAEEIGEMKSVREGY
jgi:predicted DNA repair protein MutK